ncbi:MAG: MerR family transcriptional regulator [Neisseria sp.]|nr:MerR family transcriptional regulator [Neisseria sp.]
MQTKEFAAQTGLSAATLRYYEREGLLHPERDAKGYREYGARDLEWVGFILRLKDMGVPLAQIKEYARLRHLGDETIPRRYRILQEHQAALERKRQELAAHQAFLEDKLALYRAKIAESERKWKT